LAGRKIALVVLGTPQWPIVKLHLEKIAIAVNAATAGSYIEVVLSASPQLVGWVELPPPYATRGMKRVALF